MDADFHRSEQSASIFAYVGKMFYTQNRFPLNMFSRQNTYDTKTMHSAKNVQQREQITPQNVLQTEHF